MCFFSLFFRTDGDDTVLFSNNFSDWPFEIKQTNNMPSHLILLILLFHIHSIYSSNWAQSSGPKLQNNAQTEETPWEARWGQFVGVLQLQRPPACAGEVTPTMNMLGDEELKAGGGNATGGGGGAGADDQLIMVMGGDDYNRYDGGGYFYNDVWSSPGVLWRSIVSTVETTKWGDPLAKIQAEMAWKRVKSVSQPPSGTDYIDWIACASSRVTFAGIICDENGYKKVGGVDKWHPAMKCECPSSEYDQYPSRSWGARRDAAAIGYGRLIFVIGGRSRSMTDIPVSETIGGIHEDKRPKGFIREKSVLMNDVWSSGDGLNWKLETPGCGHDHMQGKYLIFGYLCFFLFIFSTKY